MVACRWWNQNSSTPVFRPHVRATKKGFASTLCVWIRNPFGMGGQAYYIAPLQPAALAAVKPWGIHKELAV